MAGYTLSNLGITETFYGWFNKTNDIIAQLNSVAGQGVSGAGLSGDHLIITLIDGSTFDAGSAVGATGAAVVGAAITNGELILTLDTDPATQINAGYVMGPTGETGPAGPAGSTGHTVRLVQLDKEFQLAVMLVMHWSRHQIVIWTQRGLMLQV